MELLACETCRKSETVKSRCIKRNFYRHHDKNKLDMKIGLEKTVFRIFRSWLRTLQQEYIRLWRVYPAGPAVGYRNSVNRLPLVRIALRRWSNIWGWQETTHSGSVQDSVPISRNVSVYCVGLEIGWFTSFLLVTPQRACLITHAAVTGGILKALRKNPPCKP